MRLLRQLCSFDRQSGGQVGRQRSPILGYGEQVQTESFQELGSLDDRELWFLMVAWLAGNSVKPSQRPNGPPRSRGRRRRSCARDSPPCSRLSLTSTIITAATAFVRLGPPGFPSARSWTPLLDDKRNSLRDYSHRG